jgi:hypothetical protein
MMRPWRARTRVRLTISPRAMHVILGRRFAAGSFNLNHQSEMNHAEPRPVRGFAKRDAGADFAARISGFFRFGRVADRTAASERFPTERLHAGSSQAFPQAWLLGESSARLAALTAWQGSALFTEQERAALEWSEAVAFASRSRVPDRLHATIRQWFTDIEIVKLTVVIAATMAWNHVEMTFSQRDLRPLSGAL